MQGIRLCPAIHEVFLDCNEEIQKYIKPLIAIDLSLVNANWQGEIFIVYHMDDGEGGEPSKYYNENCKLGEVAFDIVNGKYKFNGDHRYFAPAVGDEKFFDMGNKSYAAFIEEIKKEEPDPFEYLENFNQKPLWLQWEDVPLNSKGEPMKFIGQTSSYKFIDDYCDVEIYLFYDHDDQRAVQITQND